MSEGDRVGGEERRAAGGPVSIKQTLRNLFEIRVGDREYTLWRTADSFLVDSQALKWVSLTHLEDAVAVLSQVAEQLRRGEPAEGVA